MTNNAGIAKTPDARTIVQKAADMMVPMMVKQLEQNGIQPDAYQKQCMLNAIMVINDLANANGLTINEIERTTFSEILQQVATLRLNPFSQPRECYFTTRRKKAPSGEWMVTVEMGIEGDGNEAILRNFGHNVAEVFPYWAVREGDDFTYPVHRGIEVEPPIWQRSGKGKYVRVVYPIRFKDGTIQYFIGEREDVRVNLVAHVSNNMMNETFGIVESRYKATVEQKQKIDERKAELKALMDGKDLEEILDIPELQPYISPAWREGSRELMILRKMRNNCIKPIPKDFSNSLALSMYNNSLSAEEGVSAKEQPLEADYREIPDPAALTTGEQGRTARPKQDKALENVAQSVKNDTSAEALPEPANTAPF